ncbi:MAG TPA: ester cyclase [Beijerinckiaceae bacterium]|nr:ester cyclase [Beijerinckiaceae bacterium]
MMNRRDAVIAASIAAVAGGIAPVLAASGDRVAVEAFYGAFLTANGQDVAAEGEKVMAPGFESIGDFSGKSKKRDELIQQIQGFHKLVPDLKWQPEEIIEAGNRIVVRSRASGTPRGPLFGVDGKGKSFTLMSIDIHEVVGGRIARVYHVEDWAGALRQLSAQ